MKLINNTLHSRIDVAIHDAERMFHPGSPMMHEIRSKNDWKYNSGTGIEVYEKLINYAKLINIFTYRPPWMFSKAIGYSDKLGIHINAYKLPKLSHVDLVTNLCHEACHAAGFSHGSNWSSRDKNQFSVPYFVSSNIERWL